MITDILNDTSRYRRTSLKQYEVKISRPPVGTDVHNIFNNRVERISSYIPFLITGPLGEESIAKGSDIEGRYMFSDRTIITELELNNRLARSKNGVVNATRCDTEDSYWVILIPNSGAYRNYSISSLVINPVAIPLYGIERIYKACAHFDFSRGQVYSLKNQQLRDRSQDLTNVYSGKIGGNQLHFYPNHGKGDYIVRRSIRVGGTETIDWNSLEVVNGDLFEAKFNMTPLKTAPLDTSFILLPMYLRDFGLVAEKLGKEGKASFVRETYQCSLGRLSGTLTLTYEHGGSSSANSSGELRFTASIYGKDYNIGRLSEFKRLNGQLSDIDLLIGYVTEAIQKFKSCLEKSESSMVASGTELASSVFKYVGSELSKKYDYSLSQSDRAEANELWSAYMHLHPRHKDIRLKVVVYVNVVERTARSTLISLVVSGNKPSGGPQLTITDKQPIYSDRDAAAYAEDMCRRYTQIINGPFERELRSNHTEAVQTVATAGYNSAPSRDTSTTTLQPKMRHAQLAEKVVEDWFGFICDQVCKGMANTWAGEITISTPSATRMDFLVSGEKKLVLIKVVARDEKGRPCSPNKGTPLQVPELVSYNSSKNVRKPITSSKEVDLLNIAHACVRFSRG